MHESAEMCGDYQAKISGPMLDLMNLQVDVPAVEVGLTADAGESSAEVAARIAHARNIQNERFAAQNVSYSVNAKAEGDVLANIGIFEDNAQELLEKSMQTAKLSARGYYRIIRVARTIADLESVQKGQIIEKIGKTHIAEALSYRRTALS